MGADDRGWMGISGEPVGMTEDRWGGGTRRSRRRANVMGGVFPGEQGATVLHCLARLYKTAIQGAT
jgi:hypothetical protein